tara:strand:+ start:215 stop:805 length:591 start_codon:yes stop_codon:yes gene_type:complete
MKRLSFVLFFLIVFAQTPILSNTKSRNFDLVNISLIGWKPAKIFAEENKANFKTLEALNKFRKIRRLKPYFKEAYGFAVFPNVGKAGFGIGGSRGKGEVFREGKVIGSTTLTQLSIGFQLGAQAYSQIIFFQNKRDLDIFTAGNYEFGASASAALITEGANASADYRDGVAVMTFSKGGLMYEASIGGQKFTFRRY